MMTNEEKIEIVKSMLGSDEQPSDAELLPYIELAGSMVLERRYPFGYEDGTEVPEKYSAIQCNLAVELWSRRGAEGESAHSENGISRTYNSISSLLKFVTPLVGSVVKTQ